MTDYATMPELDFENEVIQYLTRIAGTKQWEYVPEIKTTEQLWDNFKRILEQNNRARLDRPLSHTEFSQVKKAITDIRTPYEAGQFLYGINGVSQKDIVLDDGRTVYLTFFDQAQVGAGNTVYQIVNQIQRPKILDTASPRRFDVTLLINGLPIIQIELKRAMHDTSEALNQMEQYIQEKQYSDIFSTLQILIGMTPYDVRYMANATAESFNKAFAFNWQDENDAHPIHDWKTFADKALSIPMAHDLATRFMVLDGTKNKESIKVMRPYQVYATKRVLDKVAKFKFDSPEGKLGYVWHTTGSGKTITSFKTAWLASRLPNVSKVIFLVDRIALTNQTVDAYQAYDPTPDMEGKTGVIADTANVADLHRKLTRKSDKNIIVTSIQKMSRYVKSDRFKKTDQHILFIVDEAHRSTGDGRSSASSSWSSSSSSSSDQKQQMLEAIRQKMPTAGWVGYTGTPKFPQTREIFGDLLHAYTIKEAIADKNVLGFKVQFKETIKPPENPTEDELNDIRATAYDTSHEHVELVVDDIMTNWRQRSNDGQYNAMLTVHVGGMRASTPRAMEYFDEFARRNAQLSEAQRLKVAVSFSADTSNGDDQNPNNEGLRRAMASYNAMFGTAYDMTTSKEYTEDIARRLNRSAPDKQFLDIAIVVDQFLTGFDAPQMNTLYVDRRLKGAGLIQAYSRTNRVHNMQSKPWGNVINYRWPEQNEVEMNEAFFLYSNKENAAEQDELPLDMKEKNEKSGVLAKPFAVVQKSLRNTVETLREMTDGFTQVPESEEIQQKIFELVKHNYNPQLSELKQFSEDDEGNRVSAYDDPEGFYGCIGMTQDEEVRLISVIIPQIIRNRSGQEDTSGAPVDIDFEMVHVHDVKINYDYLTELLATMANHVHEKDMDAAREVLTEIHAEVEKTNNVEERDRVRGFADEIMNGYDFGSYPVSKYEDMSKHMDRAQKLSARRQIAEFLRYWGLDNATRPDELEHLIAKHRRGEDDLDDQKILTDIMNKARDSYADFAAEEVASYSWLKYRKALRTAAFELAEKIQKER
ncbi:DEAD/DEAH box helicase [Alloscardovia macacae]|uniref:Type I restriction enzyme endonuclease subunit n=1 Tax=Alloscardovia macacae TaxID=1160091 RepID=A0A1Y2SUV1_9BIFI|nr:HsdR family type I site-specific deoxyribonuclease [Alloscardovia macacae]OTA25840.1 DEAD/DEAH box helicase [Alloscardovia macacae]OTA28679.1 DEAD/DEAH box helicase [Alloscardovia macacae]